MIDNTAIEQAYECKRLECKLLPYEDLHLEEKLKTFDSISGSIRRTYRRKVNKDTLLKCIKAVSVPSLLCGS
jgi:hypothetical protein